jgi:hypothetical protein
MAAMERVKSWWWAIGAVVPVAGAFELTMGRSPICP